VLQLPVRAPGFERLLAYIRPSAPRKSSMRVRGRSGSNHGQRQAPRLAVRSSVDRERRFEPAHAPAAALGEQPEREGIVPAPSVVGGRRPGRRPIGRPGSPQKR